MYLLYMINTDGIEIHVNILPAHMRRVGEAGGCRVLQKFLKSYRTCLLNLDFIMRNFTCASRPESPVHPQI